MVQLEMQFGDDVPGGVAQHDPGGKVRRPLRAGIGMASFGGQHSEYRYVLGRKWDSRASSVMFVMMNPSTADANIDDPTVARCIDFAQRWGAGTLYVTNIFAYRATHPLDLLGVDDPVGPENDAHILRFAHVVGPARAARPAIIMAHGNPPSLLRARGVEVCTMLRRHGFGLHALGINKDGSPRHPLYVRGDVTPFEI